MMVDLTSWHFARHLRIIWFAFVASDPEPGRVIQPYQLRDTLAFTEILTTLGPHRYRQGWEVVINAPGGEEVLSPALEPSDLIVITTRFPIDDDPQSNRKIIPRSGVRLETKIRQSLRLFYSYNTRTRIGLSEKIAENLLPSKKDRRKILFSELKEAVYRQMAPDEILRPVRHEDANLTAGYLSFTPEVWRTGPALLCLFGVSGHETMTWARFLARHRRDWLRTVVDDDKACFYMAEWDVSPYPRTPDLFLPRSLAVEDVEDVVGPAYYPIRYRK